MAIIMMMGTLFERGNPSVGKDLISIITVTLSYQCNSAKAREEYIFHSTMNRKYVFILEKKGKPEMRSSIRTL